MTVTPEPAIPVKDEAVITVTASTTTTIKTPAAPSMEDKMSTTPVPLESESDSVETEMGAIVSEGVPEEPSNLVANTTAEDKVSSAVDMLPEVEDLNKPEKVAESFLDSSTTTVGTTTTAAAATASTTTTTTTEVPMIDEVSSTVSAIMDNKTTSSPLSPGTYYPVTTTTVVTSSSATWPYPTSTPPSAALMSSGACLFDGRVFMSAQQIPREDPCDFCFCFRGDIICLQQSCPPPIPGCYEEPIPGFCCPRYECPVGTGNSTTAAPLFPPTYYHNQLLNGGLGGESGQVSSGSSSIPSGPGCEIQGEYYETGQIVTSTSGPCLECR